MSTRNPDTSSAVMVVLFSATMLVCLIGAFVLPSPISLYRWLGFAFIGLVVSLPLLTRAAHRSRIRRAVEERGGNVIRIRRLPFWKQGFDYWHGGRRVMHEVEYADATGFVHEAACLSDFLHGVEWVSDTVFDSNHAHL